MDEIQLMDGSFAAPEREGVYFYAVRAVWDGKDTFGGDASYGFVVKVEANPVIDTQ
jgi:hypothetical protein